jgi:hypothetical protein
MVGVRRTDGLPRLGESPIFERGGCWTGRAALPEIRTNSAGNTSEPALGPYRWASKSADMGMRWRFTSEVLASLARP